jgi:hypothetical protein
MKRLILSLLLLALMAAGLAGCHASAEVDPHHSTQLQPAN